VNLAPHARFLTDAHIELLLKDLPGGYNELNCIALSLTSLHVTLQPLTQLLVSDSGEARRKAAYVLGWHKNPDGFPILLDWLAEPITQNHLRRLNPIIPAFLSTYGTPEYEILEQFADPNNPRYSSQAESNGVPRVDARVYAPAAKFVVDVLHSASVEGRLSIVDSAFGLTMKEIETFARSKGKSSRHRLKKEIHWCRQYGSVSYGSFNQAQEFLSAFFPVDERKALAQRNEAAVHSLFEEEDLGFEELLDGRHLLLGSKMDYSGFEPEAGGMSNFSNGVRYVYDRTDYIRYATEWILNPAAFRLQ